jgi:hypothetical protein
MKKCYDFEYINNHYGLGLYRHCPVQFQDERGRVTACNDGIRVQIKLFNGKVIKNLHPKDDRLIYEVHAFFQR